LIGAGARLRNAHQQVARLTHGLQLQLGVGIQLELRFVGQQDDGTALRACADNIARIERLIIGRRYKGPAALLHFDTSQSSDDFSRNLSQRASGQAQDDRRKD
jgi:hypothetical protein